MRMSLISEVRESSGCGKRNGGLLEEYSKTFVLDDFSKGWQTLVLAVGVSEGYETIHVEKLGDV
jgi:hypothetical protein